MFNLDPLITQLKEYNLNQALVLQELKEIKEHLKKYSCNCKITKST